jgi:L-threonate 2-dehydrogenase
MRVSIVGLGIVRMALSQRLLRAGYEVAGWHQDPRRVHAFADMGGTRVAGVAELAAVADVCFWALPSVAAERAATDEMLRSNRLPAVIAELSTLPIDAKIETRDRFAGMGTIVLDCAISGTGAQIAAGDAVVYASGDRTALAGTTTHLRRFAQSVFDVGDFGNGSSVKYIAKLLVAVHNVVTAEALGLARKLGLDQEQVFESVSAGAATSRMFEIRGRLTLDERYEPPTATISLFQEDIGIVRERARAVGAATPMLDACAPIYDLAAEGGLANRDPAAVYRALSPGPSSEPRNSPCT